MQSVHIQSDAKRHAATFHTRIISLFMKPDTSINEQYSKAYKEADLFELKLQAMLNDSPIEKFPFFWMKFCRTIATSLDVINQTSMSHVEGRLKRDELEILNRRISALERKS